MTARLSPTPECVELWCGTVTGSFIEDARGRRPVPVLVEKRYFVDVIDPEGCRISIWDGRSHDDAIEQARAAAKDWGLKGYLDLAVGGAA